MSKPFFVILFLATVPFATAQQVEFFMESSFPAKPLSGETEVAYLFESQMVYPKEELELKKEQEVFVVVHVSWDGKLDTIFTNIDENNAFAQEAVRLVRLIVWKRDRIREGKKIENQQIKVTFDPKKYSRFAKKRKLEPVNTAGSQVYIARNLDTSPKVKNYNTVNDYVRDNIKYPALALQRVISGSVTVSFVIEKNGMPSNFAIIKPLAGGCNEETIRLLKNIAWEPGIKDGKPVRVQSEYTLNFVHPGNSYR